MVLETALVLPDLHVPYENKKAVQLVMKVGKFLKPKEIVFLGDIADFYAVNSHGKHPTLQHLLIDEVEAVNKFLDKFDKEFPNVKKVYLEANHEFRFERFILNNAPALFGVTECKNLFKISQRKNWKWIPYGPNQAYKILGSKLLARHEPLGPNAQASAARSMANIVFGHVHRISSAYAVGLDGTQYINFSPGWLGDGRKDKIFGYTKYHQSWQLGFSVVRTNPANGMFYPQICPILPDMSCVVDGKRFSV